MSAAAAESPEAVATASPKRGKKKLVILVIAGLLLALLAGGGVVLLMKKKAAAHAAAEAEDGETAQVESHDAPRKRDAKHAPTFVPLDTFTVNLADREVERYAQIGVTLELEDAKVADDIKAFMPAIRNNVLLVLAQKTSQELLEREGKQRLAFEIKREAARALGVEIEDELAKAAAKSASGAAAGKKPGKRRVYEPSPVTGVHFSNFIIQ